MERKHFWPPALYIREDEPGRFTKADESIKILKKISNFEAAEGIFLRYKDDEQKFAG
jgi:hypothetical protein